MNVVVWNGFDLIGLGLIGAVLLLCATMAAYLRVLSWLEDRKKR